MEPVLLTAKIAKLNDTFRQTFMGGPVMLTSGIRTLPSDTLKTVLQQVRAFDAFTTDNDPYGEHDFGTLTVEGHRIFWKIDYYDSTLTYGSEQPENPELTIRVLTIMLAEEY